jgi:hypothetical protein
MTQTAVSAPIRLSIADQFDSDKLPTTGDPMLICPETAAHWAARLKIEEDCDKAYAILEEDRMLSGKDPVKRAAKIAKQMDRAWMNRRAKQFAKSEKATVKGLKIGLAFCGADDTMSVPLAPVTPVSEFTPSDATHKVEAPTTSPRPAAVPTFHGSRQTRTKKSAYVPRPQRRYLDMYEKKQLRNGRIPAILALTPHLVRLELREHLWYAQAKFMRSASRHFMAKARAFYVVNA